MPVKVVAIVTPKPGCEEAVERELRTVVATTRAEEPGNLRYDLWKEPGAEGRFVFDELYVDAAAVAAHRRTEHYTAFRAAMADLLAAAPSVYVVETADVADAT